MTLPPPPYVVKSVDSTPDQDQHGNTGAFVTLTNGQSALLRMKGMFPLPGDEITDRVLVEKTSQSGNTYLKLEKPQRNGNSGVSVDRSQRLSGDGPGEAYWAGQNAAKGRAHAQEMALRTLALIAPEQVEARAIINWVDFFQKDAEQARDRAVEEASSPPGASSHDSNGIASAPAAAPPEPVGQDTYDSPTEKQVNLMLLEARKKGMDGPAMSAVLKHRLGVETFSALNKRDCVDKWRAALSEPTPDPAAPSDVPVDWPPVEEPALTPSDDSDIPF